MSLPAPSESFTRSTLRILKGRPMTRFQFPTGTTSLAVRLCSIAGTFLVAVSRASWRAKASLRRLSISRSLCASFWYRHALLLRRTYGEAAAPSLLVANQPLHDVNQGVEAIIRVCKQPNIFLDLTPQEEDGAASELAAVQ
ncbi:hypothetical protein BKA65DRAFT_471947 [Rhexocercosporidium sp. MPI-PUGE-AT-0058]|nr:hypothetical protein BKA65DRAFT_471947 [Rhexocercosporidium sp. MPI-PUGE-AT-0058]